MLILKSQINNIFLRKYALALYDCKSSWMYGNRETECRAFKHATAIYKEMKIQLSRFQVDYDKEAEILANNDNADNDLAKVLIHNKNSLQKLKSASRISASSSQTSVNVLKPFPRETFQFREDEFDVTNDEIRYSINPTSCIITIRH